MTCVKSIYKVFGLYKNFTEMVTDLFPPPQSRTSSIGILVFKVHILSSSNREINICHSSGSGYTFILFYNDDFTYFNMTMKCELKEF